jgi:hypothetical protein
MTWLADESSIDETSLWLVLTNGMINILPFTDQSNSFTNGFEAGRLEDRMRQGHEAVSNDGFPVHLANKEVLITACKIHGYTPVFGEEYYDQWIEFIAIKIRFFNN